MKNRRPLVHSLLITLLCAASLLLGCLAKANAEEEIKTQNLDNIKAIGWLDATGGVINHVTVSNSFYLQLDTSIELYGLNGTDSFSTPSLPSWFKNNYFPSATSGVSYWEILSPTEKIGDYLPISEDIIRPWSSELQIIKQPNELSPLSPANRVNMFSFVKFFANTPGKTYIQLREKNYGILHTFYFIVDPITIPLPWTPSNQNSTPSESDQPNNPSPVIKTAVPSSQPRFIQPGGADKNISTAPTHQVDPAPLKNFTSPTHSRTQSSEVTSEENSADANNNTGNRQSN